MKKTLLVILALVIALTLVIGSVSTVSAARSSPITLEVSNLTPHGPGGNSAFGYFTFDVNIAWTNVAVSTIYEIIYDNTLTTNLLRPVLAASATIPVDGKKSTYSYSGIHQLGNAYGYTVDPTHDYTLYILILNSKAIPIKFATAQFNYTAPPP